MSNTLSGTELLQFLLEKNAEEFHQAVGHIHPADILDALAEYEGDRITFLARLPNDVLTALIEEEEEEEKAKLLDLFPTERKHEIISEMASDELVDLLETIDPEEAESLIDKMEESQAQELKALLTYDSETAGGIMATEFVSISTRMTVKDTLEYLQTHGEEAESLNYLYILDPDKILKGVVALRDIVTSHFSTPLTELINPKVVSVHYDVDQEDVAQIFHKYGFASLPVVDEKNKMLGIITADDVLDIVVDETTEDFERMSALAHNEGEYLQTSVFGLARRRIFWLLFLMISATFTGTIIQRYEKSLAEIVILVAFIPVLMDTGGNAGSQSATLIIRGMALGEINMKDFFAVLFKELRVSLMVGIVLAVVNALRIWTVHGNLVLGLTVSTAMFFTVIMANVVGCTLPLLAKRLKLDPAIMAAPIITTIVDALALIVYFKLATMVYL